MSAAKTEERPKGAEARERGQKADKVRGGTPLASISSVTLHPISQRTLVGCGIFYARKRGSVGNVLQKEFAKLESIDFYNR